MASCNRVEYLCQISSEKRSTRSNVFRRLLNSREIIGPRALKMEGYLVDYALPRFRSALPS